MNLSAINWWAVLVCVIVNLVVGFAWYNPKTFFPAWWKAIGKTDQDAPGTGSNMSTTWVLSILAAFVEATAMAFVVKTLGSLMPGGVSWATGANVGFMLWLGFVAPTFLVNKMFEGRGLTAWVIEVGNHLVNFLLFGAILGAWH